MKASVLMVTLLCGGCATMGPPVATYPKLTFPPLPSSCADGGKAYPLNTAHSLDMSKQEGQALFIDLVNSDRRNARAVRSCRAYYAKIRRLYNARGGQ